MGGGGGVLHPRGVHVGLEVVLVAQLVVVERARTKGGLQDRHEALADLPIARRAVEHAGEGEYRAAHVRRERDELKPPQAAAVHAPG